ncbi:hypothetical protein Lser_V15G13810 [Lactuca serriola]
MAEIVVSAFFSVFFEKLASEAFKKIARAKGIDSQLNKLKRSLIQIKALLNDASQKEITDQAVKEWLNGLQQLAYDIDDLLDELATEAMHRELTDEFGASTSMNWIIGREGEKDALLHKLLGDEACDKNFSIVPIVGMGGVGKTTLARLLYDEMHGKAHFELKAWVCVSDEFDIFNISKVIFQSIGGGNKEFKDLNLLQVALKEKISKKRFLLVLDDVWSESYTDWEILERPFLAGAPGSKIIITTRKLSLLTQLGYSQPYSLSVLSHENAVSLFCQHAFGENNFDSHQTLKPHGEGIVKKCDGLPLALIVLGRLLRTKTDEEEWKELLNSEIWSLGKRDEITPALRLSYHDLSANLKLLFAYCSLFPKDYMFEMEELILLWMAEGFLHQSSTTGKSMERMGVECFEDLLSRSFFQQAPNDKSLFVMHDLMNDLAMSIAGEFFSRLDIEMKKEIGKADPGKYRHMSFVCEEYMIYTKFEALKGAHSLRTFLALSSVRKWWQEFQLSNKILTDLIRELPLLRVISLSRLSINEVPEFIGCLKHLRYLNFSRTKITHLPDNVCDLYNLQTLIIFGCHRLEKLPNSFKKLKNLRHFDMRGNPLLKKMPLGIGELKSLRTLSKIIIDGDNGFSITELKDLKDLQGKISFKGLDKVRNPMRAQEVNLSHRRLSELEEVLNVMKPHNDNLKHLRVVLYGGTEFPSWVGDPSFHRLAEVTLNGCKKCTSLPLLGQLPSLKELVIEGMDEVKVVGLELLGTTGPAFPSLETLHFKDMKGWEAWSTNNNGVLVDTTFPCLQELFIWNCPNLVRVSIEALPSLRVLRISWCGHEVFGSLVRLASSVTKLDIDDISGLNDQVWGGVIEHLGAVQELSISRCNEIRYLWESEAEASTYVVNLRKLHVWDCSNLVRLGEKEEDNCGSYLTSLTSFEVWHSNSLEHFRCPNSLKSLTIAHCNKLLEKELIGGREKPLINSNILMLESVCIIDWPNLKSITELSSFNHLLKLEISDCPNLESFPDHELPKLNVLTHLAIVRCLSMDASFSRGLWPPKLCFLLIGGLKKPVSMWGPQTFPTSLVELGLTGGQSEDVSNFSQLSHLLPSSLTSFGIIEFEKLESVSKGLQHLTSFQHLSIYNCPKAMDLPEMLLPSLLSLRIWESPNLKERISKRGSYWPLVSRIPCIDIS